MAYDSRSHSGIGAPYARDPDVEARLRLAGKLLEEQNFVAAIVAGLVGALAGALAWGAVALGTGAIVAVVAIGVGAIVGFGVRVFGQGVTDVFALAAAGLAVFGCALGNLMALVLFEMSALDLSPSEALSLIEPARLYADFVSTLGIMELFYWLVAAYSAWWLARRGLTEEESKALDEYARQRPG